MLAGFQIAQRVALVWVDLQLVGFVRLDQSIDELWCMEEVDIFVDQTVDDEQTVVPVDEEKNSEWVKSMLGNFLKFS